MMSESIMARISALDWPLLHETLDEQGYAVIPPLLRHEECLEIIGMYDDDTRFRSRIDMARYRFGVGEYKYYQAPLPSPVQELRTGFYDELAIAANRWLGLKGQEAVYPPQLQDFLEHCHRHDQERATPLLLKYEEGGYNCLHQDLYGDVFFPFQVLFMLSQKDIDYTGGEFLLVEQRPRAQSRGHAVTLERGAGIIFPTKQRPVAGSRGYYQTALRHGVSTVLSGTRYGLGIIFHDAK
jgi:hypothetical protein